MTAIDPVKIIFFIARVVPIIILIFILAALYAVIISFPEEIGVDRTIGELAENIVQHNLTIHRTVFNATELEKYDGSTAEPYVRHCKYGYYLEIEDLRGTKSCSNIDSQDCKDFCMDVCGLSEDELIFWHTTENILFGNCACYTRVCQCRKDITDDEAWKTSRAEARFGYNPKRIYNNLFDDILTEKGLFYNANVENEITKEYYVSVPNGDTVNPARMKLTVYDTWLSRVSCLVEKAYHTQKPQSTGITCLVPYHLTRNGDCWLPIRKSGDNICIIHVNLIQGGIRDIDCRNLTGIDLLYFDYPYEEAGTLIAIPIKHGHSLSTAETYKTSEENCNKIESHKSWIAGKGDEVDTVLLCMSEDFNPGFVSFLFDLEQSV